jgi:1,4-dihydroxy-2-naphthoate octaprenyltransferase
MTMLAVVCAFLYVRATGGQVVWAFLPLMLLSATLLHAGTNLLNDYYDYALGFDTEDANGASGVIQDGTMPEKEMLVRGRLYVLLGALAGLFFVVVYGYPILVLGALGVCGAYFYSHPRGYKYMGLGEVAVFGLMGLALFTGSVVVAGGQFALFAFIPAAALGVLVTAVLLINNIRDMEMDGNAGFRTLPMRIGRVGSHGLLVLLLVAASLTPPLLFFLHDMAWPILLPLFTLPIAARIGWRVIHAHHPATDLAKAPEQAAMLYTLYAITLSIGLLLCKHP